MPKPRTPTHKLEQRGAYTSNPGRKRKPAPSGVGDIGKPPTCFDKEHKQAWKEIVAMAPEGVLSGSDRLIVEVTARMLVDLRQRPKVFTASMYSNLMGALGRMGLSPIDRERVSVAPGLPADPESADAMVAAMLKESN